MKVSGASNLVSDLTIQQVSSADGPNAVVLLVVKFGCAFADLDIMWHVEHGQARGMCVDVIGVWGEFLVGLKLLLYCCSDCVSTCV